MTTGTQAAGRAAPRDAGGTVKGGWIVGELDVRGAYMLLGRLLGRQYGIDVELVGLRRKEDRARQKADMAETPGI